jgi:hypothetical protein
MRVRKKEFNLNYRHGLKKSQIADLTRSGKNISRSVGTSHRPFLIKPHALIEPSNQTPRFDRTVLLQRNRVATSTRNGNTFAKVCWNVALATIVQTPRNDRTVFLQRNRVAVSTRNGNTRFKIRRNVALAFVIATPRFDKTIFLQCNRVRVSAQ